MAALLREMTDKPWFSEYELCRIPRTLKPYPSLPVFSLLEEAADKYPHSGAVQLGVELKYPELRDRAWRLAAALAELGVEKGDRVATILPTSLQFMICDYGISRAGAAQIPSSFLEPEYVLSHKFQEGRPKVLIGLVDDPRADLNNLQSLARQAEVKHLVITRLEDFSNHPPAREQLDGAHWLADLIEQHPPSPPRVDLDPSRDLETLLFSGGTTGLPKGCMLTHGNVMANALQSTATFGPLVEHLNGKFSVLLGIPFYHSYGHIIMHTITRTGATQLLIPDPRDTASILQMIKTYYPVLQFGVPTQFMKMLKEELKEIRILGISGSAALPPEVQEQFETKSGGGIMEGYGLSECSPNTHINPSLAIRLLGGREKNWIQKQLDKHIDPLLKYGLGTATKHLGREAIGKSFSFLLPLLMKNANRPEVKKEDRKGSVGVPFVDTEIKVMDESGRELTCEELLQGQVGEMWINGPQRMLGYWPQPGSGIDQDGYVHTGDVVKMDPRGYFYVVDRTKDMIIVSGFKVYSREIDDILYQHPAVELAAAIGVPDPERPGSERVKVYIQLKSEQRGKVSEGQFLEYLKDKVAKYSQPRQVEFIDEMPLTGVQKVDKKTLRKMASEN